MTEPKEVTLCMPGRPMDETPPEERGLILWKIKNQHNIEGYDVSVLYGDEAKSLRSIKFDYQRKIDWDDWKRVCIPRLKHAAKLGIPHLPELLPHKGRMAIVGAGPSVSGFVDDIKKYKISDLDNIMSLNGAHEWLIQHGVPPRIHVIAEIDDADVEVHLGGAPHKDVVYYISSSCPESISRQLANYKRVLWHPFMPMQGYQQAINRYFKNEFMVCSGWATFFKSLSIAATLGFRQFELFGIDSSFEESSHIDDYAMADKEPKITVWGGDSWGKKLRKFTSQGGLVYQAKEFLEFCKYNQSALRLRVRGDGLLRHLHECRYPDQYYEQKGL